MAGLEDTINSHLPRYLSADDYGEVVGQLRQFRNYNEYYLSFPPTEKALQGDCWAGLPIFGADASVRGMILSNSCDIDADNAHRPSKNVLFSPMIKLSVLQEVLSEQGVPVDRISKNLQDIRSQELSDVFYLPHYPPLDDEYVVFLDDIYHLPVNDFVERGLTRLSCLSQTAFFIFLIKLSIHFTRLREGVRRFDP